MNVTELWTAATMAALCLLALCAPVSGEEGRLPTEDGFRCIWYPMGPSAESGGVKRYKYSGGLGTYPHQMLPFAVYRPEVNKTFFCYGGTARGKRELLHMISCYDHNTGEVARPVVLMNKETDDAHDNPTIAMDADGYLWIFSNSHGTSRPSYIHRSTRPYSFDSFELIEKTNFSYGQPWYIEGRGFLFLHTRYEKDMDRATATHRGLGALPDKRAVRPVRGHDLRLPPERRGSPHQPVLYADGRLRQDVANGGRQDPDSAAGLPA